MLICKLAQALGEGAVCYSFAVVCALWGCLSQLSDGKALSDKLSELPRGVAMGAALRSWMMLGGLSQASGSFLCFGTRCWHVQVGKGFWKAQRPVLVAHAWDVSSSLRSRWGNQPSLPQLWHCPGPAEQDSCVLKPQFSIQICSAWPRNRRVYACRSMCAAVAGQESFGLAGCSGLANWVLTAKGNKQRKQISFSLTLHEPTARFLSPAPPLPMDRSSAPVLCPSPSETALSSAFADFPEHCRCNGTITKPTLGLAD